MSEWLEVLSKSSGILYSESSKFQIFLGEHAPNLLLDGAGKLLLRVLNFKYSWGNMPSKTLSYVCANHSCKILDPPLLG